MKITPEAFVESNKDKSYEELLAAGGLYARMWADYQQAVQWKIGKEAC